MEFDQAVAQLETLVTTLERDGDERALELLRLMDAIHRPALELMLSGNPDHPIAAAVLAMYELVPLDEHTQVEEALDEIRPYIESHGGGLELLDVDGGVVHVRLSGSCHGCAASAMTLRRGVETKLRERIPWFTEIIAHEPEAADDGPAVPEGSIALPMVHFDPGTRPAPPAEQLARVAQLKRPVFVDVGTLADLAPGAMTHAAVDDKDILVLNVEGEPYAFHNVCPVDGRSPLDGGRLTGSVLVCPWHNCAYDARSGRRADDEPGQQSLAVVPIAVSSEGVLRVAANVA
jgi:Fe-S cluster biogenesis protein NfuA/nitrite reductase/ring-hydroxylating ferredoxin subunit